MRFDKYTLFEDFALEPISNLLLYRFDNSYASYNHELTKTHGSTLREIRENKLEYENDYYHLLMYINDLHKKIAELKNSLFSNTENGIIYLLDEKEIDDSHTVGMNCIRALLRMVDGLYNSSKYDSELIVTPSIPNPLVKSRRIGPRQPVNRSFELKNPNVNLNAIHSKLIEEKNSFVHPKTPFKNFERIFLGKEIKEKVVWYNANSLRYLILSLYNNNLVKSQIGSKWIRTIYCFKPEEGEFKSKDFKDTKDPVSGVTLILDDIIKLFSS